MFSNSARFTAFSLLLFTIQLGPLAVSALADPDPSPTSPPPPRPGGGGGGCFASSKPIPCLWTEDSIENRDLTRQWTMCLYDAGDEANPPLALPVGYVLRDYQAPDTIYWSLAGCEDD